MNVRTQANRKKIAGKRENLAAKAKKPIYSPSTHSYVDQILHLQRTIGNQAVQRLIKSGTLQDKSLYAQKRSHAHELTHVTQQGRGVSLERFPYYNTEGLQHKNKFRIQHKDEAPYIQRWKISDNIAEVDRFGDTLWGLTRKITGQGRRWRDIKIISMKNKSPRYRKRYWLYLRIGDKFDISELRKIDITLPDGTKIRVDCAIPPPPKPGKPAILCNSAGIKPATGKQKTACESALKAAISDSGVQKVIGKLKKIKGCSIPTMECKSCTAGCKGAGAWHFPKAIYICADKNPNKTKVIDYLKHELTHELQDCRKDPDVTCNDRMKMEIEAYKAGGRSFKDSLKGAVWSSCYVKRCKPKDIGNKIAAEMKKYYDSL